MKEKKNSGLNLIFHLNLIISESDTRIEKLIKDNMFGGVNYNLLSTMCSLLSRNKMNFYWDNSCVWLHDH